jgi:competence protein ComEC
MRIWCLGLLTALSFCFSSTAQAGNSDGTLDIYWVDTEGGAATLIVTPAGESILIDTGNPGARDADRIFQVATKTAKLQKIDHLVTTHYHVDHFGGAAQLAKVIPIGIVHDNGDFGQKEKPSDEYLNFKADKREQIKVGEVLKFGGTNENDAARKMTITCLCARQEIIGPPANVRLAKNPLTDEAVKKPEDTSDNANSIVLLLQFGGFRFFDGGDLTWNTEEKLVCPFNLVGNVDVYQVNHHGLDVSNNPVLIKSLKPKVAVINNGPKKGCMPGTYGTLKTLDGLQSIYQLHRNERPDGDKNNTEGEYIANESGEKCTGNFVHLQVAPDAKSYTVNIPASKHAKTYEVK